MRDQHAGCVGAYLVEHDLFDFLLLSLPDNDTHSHKHGPHAQVASIAAADRQLERVMQAGGGAERVPRRARDDRRGRPLARAHRAGRSSSPTRSRTGRSLRPSGTNAERRRRSRCARRSARRWSTSCSRRAATRWRGSSRRAREIDGVDLVMWREDGRGAHRRRARRAVVRARRRACATTAARAGTSTATSTRCWRRRGRRVRQRALPRRAARACGRR